MTYQEFKAHVSAVVCSFHITRIHDDELVVEQITDINGEIIPPDRFPFYQSLGLSEVQSKAILPRWWESVETNLDFTTATILHSISLKDLYAIVSGNVFDLFSSPYLDEDCRVTFEIHDGILSTKQIVLGASGGSCWQEAEMVYNPEVYPSEFNLPIDVSFSEWTKEEWEEYGYYGNFSHYIRWSINLKELFNV